jgi:outer membrane lipoprotein SlyB
MKPVKIIVCATVLAVSPLAPAGEVLRETEDNSVGGGFGGAVGLMIGGGISGGPLGALLGGLVGALGGSLLQDGAGLSQRAYEVSTENGETRKVRSPTQEFAIGDAVVISGNRIHKSN